MCVIQSSHLPGSSLVLVGIGCRRLTSYLLCFLEKSLPAGSPAEPGTSTPGRLCSDSARCLRAPACLAEPLATHRVSLYSDLFFLIPPGSTTLPPGLLVPLDHSSSTCMGCFAHPVSVEAEGLRKVLAWGKEGRKEEYNTSAVLVLQDPG